VRCWLVLGGAAVIFGVAGDLALVLTALVDAFRVHVRLFNLHLVFGLQSGRRSA